MRHSFDVDVASEIGVEAAILESEFCFIAERIGIQDNGSTRIMVPCERL